jgi:transcriptional regulator with XRE-family HTH domain
MENSASLGVLIRRAIDDAGLTAPEVARLCGTSRQAVHGWINTGRVAKRWLPVLARVLNKPLGYFLGEDEMLPVDPLESQVLMIWRALPAAQKHELLTAAHQAYRAAYAEAVKPAPPPKTPKN